MACEASWWVPDAGAIVGHATRAIFCQKASVIWRMLHGQSQDVCMWRTILRMIKYMLSKYLAIFGMLGLALCIHAHTPLGGDCWVMTGLGHEPGNICTHGLGRLLTTVVQCWTNILILSSPARWVSCDQGMSKPKTCSCVPLIAHTAWKISL